VTQPASALSLDDELDEPPFPVSVVADALRQFGKAARTEGEVPENLHLPFA